MDNMYFKNAFLTLGHLNEETFNVTDPESVNSLEDFLDVEDTPDTSDDIEVIDMEAKNEAEMEDSYVGKIICQCDVCGALIYEDAHEIDVDEDKMIADIGEECPKCGAEAEFKVIGKVCPYQQEPEVEVEIENKYDVDAAMDAADEDEEAEEDEDESDEKDESVTVKSINGKKVTNESLGHHIEENMSCPTCGKETDKPCEKCEHESEDVQEESCNKKSVKEDLQKVDLETEDKIIHVSEEEKPVEPGEEMIEPLTSEEEEQFTTPEDFGAELAAEEAPVEMEPAMDAEAEEEMIPEESEEEPFESLNTTSAPALKEAKEIQLTHFDENQFNELAESYLKDVYTNVKSFSTEAVEIHGDELMIEGLINFESGKSKKTNFKFTSDCMKGNSVKFFGENLQISRGKKSFTLRGTVNGNELVCESLTYNYLAKNPQGISEKIYGTARTKLCESAQTPNEVNLNPKKVEEPKQTTNSAVRGDKYTAKPWAPVAEKCVSGVYDAATKSFKDVDGKTITLAMGGIVYDPKADKYYQWDGTSYKTVSK